MSNFRYIPDRLDLAQGGGQEGEKRAGTGLPGQSTRSWAPATKTLLWKVGDLSAHEMVGRFVLKMD